MIDIRALLELEILEAHVSPQEYMEAVTRAITDPRLPERRPHGDPQNLERANMCLRFVVENLKAVVRSRS